MFRVLLLIHLLLILPEFLDSEDVEFVSVDVWQETVRLSERLALRCASAVSHQIHTVTCTKDIDTDRFKVCNITVSKKLKLNKNITSQYSKTSLAKTLESLAILANPIFQRQQDHIPDCIISTSLDIWPM